MRILLPSAISDEQFEEGLDVLDEALSSVAQQKQAAFSYA